MAHRRSALALLAPVLAATAHAAPALAAPRAPLGPAATGATTLAAPTARDLAPDAATLVATLPPRARGPVHFSWRASGEAWRRTAARRPRGRRVAIRLTGLRPGTRYRFRVVLAGRAGRSSLFATTAPAPLPPPPSAPPSRTEEPPPAPAPAPPTPAPTPAPAPAPAHPPGYRNPVGGSGAFPDPTIIRDDSGTYWAFATGARFPMMRSRDLVHWKHAGPALAAKPAWAVPDGDWHPWAPSVAKTDGGWVLFYVALSAAGGGPFAANCIGVATAATPAGPFDDRGPLLDGEGAPIGCADASGLGNIDPQPFVDTDGRAYLYVSTDHACADGSCTLAPELSVIPLAPDLLSAAGERVPLFRASADSWEQAPWAPVVENPWVVERDGTYHLLYSGGAWTGDYGMGHATADSPLGPFTRTQRILAPTTNARGAGGGMVVDGPRGGRWLAYHARTAPHPAPRTLRIDPIAWPDGGGPPEIDGPSSGHVARLP